MIKKLFLLLAFAAFVIAPVGADAAEKRQNKSYENSVTVYSTGPSTLPADVPYTNKRDRDWLGGYLDDSGYDENGEDDRATSHRHEHRDWHERRRRHRH